MGGRWAEDRGGCGAAPLARLSVLGIESKGEQAPTATLSALLSAAFVERVHRLATIMQIDDVVSPSSSRRKDQNEPNGENASPQKQLPVSAPSTKALGKRKAVPEGSPDDDARSEAEMDTDEMVEEQAPPPSALITTKVVHADDADDDDDGVAFMGRKGALALCDFVRSRSM